MDTVHDCSGLMGDDLAQKARIFARDAWDVLTASPGWLAAHVAATTLYVAVEPSLAWAARDAVNALEQVAGVVARVTLPHAGVYISIGAVALILRWAEHTARKVYEATVVFALQRRQVARHDVLGLTDRVTRMVYDCLEAKKALSPFFTNLWRGVFQFVSVICWQLVLVPKWVPAVLVCVMPRLVIPWMLAPRIQQAKRHVLESNSAVTECAGNDTGAVLNRRQRVLLFGFLRLESLTGVMEAALNCSDWFVLLLMVMAARRFGIPLVPATIQMGDMAASLVALRLLNKPLLEIAKSYATFRGNWPALARTLYPDVGVPRHCAAPEKRSGFTLVELLGVLAIVGLLIGFLAPSLADMQRRGQNARCLSNLRNIYAGYVLYAAEHDGVLPPKYEIKKKTLSTSDISEGRVLNTPTNGIQTVLASYVPDVRVFRCPADSGDAQNPTPLWKQRGVSYEVKGALKKDLGTPKAYFCNKGTEIIASDPFKPWEASDRLTVMQKIAKGEHGPKDWHEGVTHIILPSGRAIGIRTKEEEKAEQNKAE